MGTTNAASAVTLRPFILPAVMYHRYMNAPAARSSYQDQGHQGANSNHQSNLQRHIRVVIFPIGVIASPGDGAPCNIRRGREKILLRKFSQRGEQIAHSGFREGPCKENVKISCGLHESVTIRRCSRSLDPDSMNLAMVYSVHPGDEPSLQTDFSTLTSYG